MPFQTRDFEELFGVEYGTVQFMALNKHLPIEESPLKRPGSPANRRGSRRLYGLDAAFRIGLTSRLRGLTMSLDKCHRITSRLSELFDTITRGEPMTPESILNYHPFKSLLVGRHIFFLEVITVYPPPDPQDPSPPISTEHNWITVSLSSPSTKMWNIAPAPYLPANNQIPGKPTPEQLQFCDIYLRVNLTAITEKIVQFIKNHPKQFQNDPYHTTS